MHIKVYFLNFIFFKMTTFLNMSNVNTLLLIWDTAQLLLYVWLITTSLLATQARHIPSQFIDVVHRYVHCCSPILMHKSWKNYFEFRKRVVYVLNENLFYYPMQEKRRKHCPITILQLKLCWSWISHNLTA